MDYATKKFGVDYVTLRGGWAKMIWEIVYRQLLILGCHIAFTYAVIYFILPMYLSDKKKWLITTAMLFLFFCAFLILDYCVTYLTSIDNNNSQIRQGMPGISLQTIVVISRTLGPVAFNLTTVVCLALVIKLLKRWWVKQREVEHAEKARISAELQLLKAQVHPHFLFNSLNNIYSFAIEGSPRAPEMIKKLSGLLHYMLYDCKKALVPLSKELNMIRDYISLEKIRYGDRLNLEVNIPDIPTETNGGAHTLIAPLLLIPFVENSFKHGTSKVQSKPKVILNITLKDSILLFRLINTKPEKGTGITGVTNHGLGLKNVRKRLELIYPGLHELRISEQDINYSIMLKINLAPSAGPQNKPMTKKSQKIYDEQT
jgi:sensor histidine kinase YesM